MLIPSGTARLSVWRWFVLLQTIGCVFGCACAGLHIDCDELLIDLRRRTLHCQVSALFEASLVNFGPLV